MSEFDIINRDNYIAAKSEAWRLISAGRQLQRKVTEFEQARRRKELKSILPPQQQRLLSELVLETWVNHNFDRVCISYHQMEVHTGMSRPNIKRALRALRRLGLAEYVRGLMTEDGEVAGSGYCATDEGRLWIDAQTSPSR